MLLGLEAVAVVVLLNEKAAVRCCPCRCDDDIGPIDLKGAFVLGQFGDLASVEALVVAQSIVQSGRRGLETRPCEVVVASEAAFAATFKERNPPSR